MEQSRCRFYAKKISAGALVVVFASIILPMLLGGAGSAKASPIEVSITFNSSALGLGDAKINYDKEITADQPGKLVTGGTGEGSTLTIQTDGKAGPGTATNPLFVTVTSQTRLDNNTSGLPSPNDSQAGVLTITDDKKDSELKNEGLGVRAFKLDLDTESNNYGLRVLNDGNGLAKLEGSKEISGDTDPTLVHEGAPHVDELVRLDFDGPFAYQADSVIVTLTKFELEEILDLEVHLKDGNSYSWLSLDKDDDSLNEVSSEVWTLTFAELILPVAGGGTFDSADLIDCFTISAEDINPEGKGKDHFLINGLSGVAVPIPTTVWLLGCGLIGLVGIRRKLGKEQ